VLTGYLTSARVIVYSYGLLLGPERHDSEEGSLVPVHWDLGLTIGSATAHSVLSERGGIKYPREV